MSSSRSSKHHKHGSSKSTSKSSHARVSETNNIASSGSSTKQPRSDSPVPSFLFVVNDLIINYDGRIDPAFLPKDKWQNILPPDDRRYYGGEIPSEVMRFYNGRVSRASADHISYSWVRQDRNSQGGIAVQPVSHQGFYADTYKVASVFSCNPLLPVVVTADDHFLRPQRNEDLNALQFIHSHLDNISQACYEVDPRNTEMHTVPVKLVAGVGASWIPSLVPCTYANPYGTHRSGGLGGELGIVLGLMAFHAARRMERGRTVNEVFLGRPGERSGLWKDYRWHSTSAPIGYPQSMQDTPRGFLVHICLDPENPTGSTMQSLAALEWQTPLVRE